MDSQIAFENIRRVIAELPMDRDSRELCARILLKNCPIHLDAANPDNLWVFGFIHAVPDDNMIMYVAKNRPELLIRRDVFNKVDTPEIITVLNDAKVFAYFFKKGLFETVLPLHCYRLLIRSLSAGNLSMIKFLFENSLINVYPEPGWMDLAAISGNCALVEFLFDNYPGSFFVAEKTVKIVSERGFADVIEVFSRKPELGHVYHGAIDAAARKGKLQVIRVLFERVFLPRREYGCGQNAIDLAAKGGHFDVVRYIFETIYQFNPDACDESAIVSASENGHFDLAVYMIEQILGVGRVKLSQHVEKAAKNGHAKFVENFCMRYRESLDMESVLGSILISACIKGHFEVVRVCSKFGVDIELFSVHRAIYFAVGSGRLDIVVAICENHLRGRLDDQGKVILTELADCPNAEISAYIQQVLGSV